MTEIQDENPLKLRRLKSKNPEIIEKSSKLHIIEIHLEIILRPRECTKLNVVSTTH